MPLQNKNRIAYLGALALLFSYIEMLLPRFVPFFRLGLGNIVILLALNLDFPSFLILTVIKSAASSMMSGTLLSPFFLISISQSVISGLVMYALFRIKKNWLGLYGISISGGAVSAFIQIGMSALYLGSGTFTLLGPMILFNIAASIITAICAIYLNIPQNAPVFDRETESIHKKSESTKALIEILFILISAVLILSINNLYMLVAGLIFAFVFQIISGRKIKVLPHLSIWLFVILVSLFSPSGKILFKIGKISITQGALLSGLEKAIKLSAIAALSQCTADIKPSSNNILSLTMNYFSALQEPYRVTNGNIIIKIRQTLQTKTLISRPAKPQHQKKSLLLSSIMLCIYICLFILNKIF